MAGSGIQKRARARRAYQRKRNNRMSMLMVMVAVLLLMVVVSVNSASLKEKRDAYQAKEALLREQINDELEKQEELVEFEKYTKTKAYYEEIAKEKLGMIHEDEIVFKVIKE